MAYTVKFSSRASLDIETIVSLIQLDSPIDATRWRRKLEEKMQSLQTMPEACSLAPENEVTDQEIRQLLHGRYRVLFAIKSESVYILTIRHGARRFIEGDEIDAI